MLNRELVVCIGYVDDIATGGHISTVNEDLMAIKHIYRPSIRLHRNITKCELISAIRPVESQSLNEFIAVPKALERSLQRLSIG